MKRLLLIILLAPLSILAQEDNVIFNFTFSTDSDNTTQTTTMIGYSKKLKNNRRIEFHQGVRRMSDRNGTMSFDVSTGVVATKITSTIDGFSTWSRLNSRAWSPFVYSSGLVYQPGTRLYVEANTEKNIIDSIVGIANQLTITTNSVSVDYKVTDELTFVVAGLNQIVNDGNRRLGSVGKIIYTPDNNSGYNIQLKIKTITSDFNPIEYFSPDKLQQKLIIVGYGRAILNDNWVIKGHIGGGEQAINGIKEFAYTYKVSMRGRSTDNVTSIASYECNDDKGDYGYSYCFGQLSATYSW